MVLALSVASPAIAAPAAAPDNVRYGPPMNWVAPPPASSETPAPLEAPVRFAYIDTQVHIDSDGERTYQAYRVKILKPEALPLGNINLAWQPSSGTATVHYLRIIRAGQVIDVLKTAKFERLQRESGLEQSILTGIVTATLQTPGLQIGDELEFAATVLKHDPTIGDHSFGLSLLELQRMPGAFRFQLSWPDKLRMNWRATRDLPAAVPASAGGRTSIVYELRDPSTVIANDGAPARYNIRRLIEYTDFASWPDVSKRFWPLYAQAATLTPASPLRGEIAKIAAANPDPVRRAEAALRLVEDQIRYVYVGLNGGNYRPATADESWTRRFGDCKAKTVLLLALLGGLGIEAEPVLVNPTGDDIVQGRLPNPALFNHIIVRVKIAGKSYWLDGTRLGDRHLDLLPAPLFRWALPLRAAGSELEAVQPKAFAQPQFIQTLDVDASAGFDHPAKVKVAQVLRGDDAIVWNTMLSSVSPDDANRALRKYWTNAEDWVEADRLDWHYDEAHGTVVLSMTGSGKPDWSGNDKEGHSLSIWGAGFYPPNYLRRPPEQDATAPWANEFPRFKCWATSIRLPPAGPRFHWTYYADAMNARLGGIAYFRAASLQSGVMKTVMSRDTYLPEIGPIDAQQQNEAIPRFNNNQSNVYESSNRAAAKPQQAAFKDQQDWVADPTPCIAPEIK